MKKIKVMKRTQLKMKSSKKEGTLPTTGQVLGGSMLSLLGAVMASVGAIFLKRKNKNKEE